jgi:uncharacterized membrane protein
MNRATASAQSSSSRDGAVVLAGVAFVSYFVALHVLMAAGTMPTLLLALILAPWSIAFAALAAKRFNAATGLVRAANVTIAFGLVFAVGWLARARWGTLVANAQLVLYLENALFFAWLAVLFATSLARQREPLVTRMARKARRGDMPPEVVRYTRRATLGWALFFAAIIALSSLLFFAGSRAAWSLFVNLLIWPLVVAAFVIEYAIRLTVLRHIRHVPLMTGFHAFRNRNIVGETDPSR